MPWIATHELKPGIHPLAHQIYNGLDCCVTFEVHEALNSLISEPPLAYNFERGLQAPALEMMLRGFKIDEYERQQGIKDLRALLRRLDGEYDAKGKKLLSSGILQRFAYAVWGKPLNPRSPKQLIDFFYGAMKLPEVWTSKKGVKKLSTDREALEKLQVYFHAQPIIACILAIRDLAKQLSVLETEVDPDGRMRTSYNIAGTETMRWSSSSSAWGTGTNLQNIQPKLRKMFIADDGWKLCGIDLEQAESREVGWLCGTLFDDWAYLDACLSGDLHTLTCKLIWRDLPWTGDPKADRAIAERIFYRDFSYRDMSKRGGHGCLTADHEVLTPLGWVPISSKPEKILQWSPQGSTFVQASNWIDKIWQGTMVAVDGNSMSLLATGDHRILYSKDGLNGKIHEAPAEKFPRVGGIPLGGGFVGGQWNITPEIARLIAAFQCDGHRHSKNRISFHFHKERKFMRLEMLAIAAGVQFSRSGNKAYLHTDQAAVWEKYAGSYLLWWKKEAIAAYLDEHKNWDGHTSATAVCLFSKNREHLEWLQTIGRIMGIGGNIQKPQTSGFGTTIYKLQQNNRKLASVSSLSVTKMHTTGVRVFCPTVPSGAFYVRRNGKISITGNSNYYGTPFTMARHLKVPTKLMEDFQRNYFAAFPAIPKYHRWCAEQLQTVQKITTPFGVTRHFFGRPNDDTTLREAIAFSPQSSTGTRMNLGLWRIWKHLGSNVQLLAQVHDAVYFQFKAEDEQEIIPKALKLIEVEMSQGPGGRSFTIPGEAKIGWNWANHHDESKPISDKNRFNPNGLKKFKLGTPDSRKRLTGLDRPL